MFLKINLESIRTYTNFALDRYVRCAIIWENECTFKRWFYKVIDHIRCWLLQVNNPASREVIASVACMGEKETQDAISSAYDAFGRMDVHIANCLQYN